MAEALEVVEIHLFERISDKLRIIPRIICIGGGGIDDIASTVAGCEYFFSPPKRCVHKG